MVPRQGFIARFMAGCASGALFCCSLSSGAQAEVKFDTPTDDSQLAVVLLSILSVCLGTLVVCLLWIRARDGLLLRSVRSALESERAARAKKSVLLGMAAAEHKTGIWHADATQSIAHLDDRALYILGLPAGTGRIPLSELEAIFLPQQRKPSPATERPDMAPFSSELNVVRRDGSARIVKAVGMMRPAQKDDMLAGIVFDITRKRDRDAHEKVLLREITHRSKNLLAIVQGLAGQTAGSAASAAAFHERFSQRLRGIAATHDLLVEQNWVDAPLRDVIAAQVDEFVSADDDRFKMTGPDIWLTTEASQNVAMALHELASNATRFGALATPGGSIEIVWTTELRNEKSDETPGALTLQWRETGPDSAARTAQPGLGFRIIERMAARALKGTAVYTATQDGLTWTLTIDGGFVSRRPKGEELHVS